MAGYIICGIIILLLIIFALSGSVKGEKKSKPVSDRKPVDRNEPEIDSLLFTSVNNLRQDAVGDIVKEAAGIKDHYFDAVYIPTAGGKPRCIRNLLFGSKGFFFVDYIDIEGWLLGNENSRWWTHFVSSEERDYLNNPVWETKEMIKDLKAFLPVTRDDDYHAYVVFSNNCELRSMELSGETRVINVRQLSALLENDLLSARTIFDEEMTEKIARVFSRLDNPDKITERLDALRVEMEDEYRSKIRAEAEKDEMLNVTGDILAVLSPEERQKLREAQNTKRYRPEERFTRAEIALRDSLIIWRKQQADARHISVMDIFDNRALDSIITLKPKNMNDLKLIPGLDENCIAQYGNMVLMMVKHASV